MKLTDIKGIGPKTEELMNKVGILTAEDLVRYYPAGYDAYTAPVPIGEVRPGAKCAVRGVIERGVTMRRFKKVTIVTTEIADQTGLIRLTWYNAPFIAGMLKRGSVWIFRGTAAERKGAIVIDHPEVLSEEKYALLTDTLVPIYSLTKGLSGKTIAKAVRAVLDTRPHFVHEFLPDALLHLHGLMEEEEAVRSIHFPENAGVFEQARRRLVFDEFFLFVLSVRMLKMHDEDARNGFPMRKTWELEEAVQALPFELTGAQKRVWREIEEALSSDRLMSRLVQGDVGSGKTVIAFLAMAACCVNGYQCAMMAPTEVLARQHYEKLMSFAGFFEEGTIRPVLLTGSTGKAERRTILSRLKCGDINAVVGTHALFQEGVGYRDLALVITDEQHRFGVRQREALSDKGRRPHTLVMSATPIPRTLGVIYYGDLDISVIDERPKRRLPIKNAVVDLTYREKALHFIDRQIEEGRQVYVICPMIDASEELVLSNVKEETAALRKELPSRRILMLHGRMTPKEKNAVMEEFAAGNGDILVSTTVIEVGIDVPNATVMLIENAERFGLAQLHQLRGRVGRGEHQSYCIFMAGQKSDQIEERLQILKESDDGFVIAEKDFEMRGPGDLLGIRQSGDAMFRIADITKDGELLKLAGETAAAVCEDDPSLASDLYRPLKNELENGPLSNERNIVL